MAFKEILSEVPKNELNNVIKIYNLAQQDIAGYEYMQSKYQKYLRVNLILENVLDGLFHIAKSDGPVNEHEVFFLRK